MPKMVSAGKFSFRLQMSEEAYFTHKGDWQQEYLRKAKYVTEPPTAEQMLAYAKAKKALKVLKDYGDMYWGRPEEEPYIDPPQGRTTVTYLETRDEWLARCRKLESENISCANAPDIRFLTYDD